MHEKYAGVNVMLPLLRPGPVNIEGSTNINSTVFKTLKSLIILVIQ